MVVDNLNEGKNSFRRLTENLPGIVYRVLLEDDNRVIFFNDMVHTMTGYSPEELKKGKVCSISPLILPEDKVHVINIVKDAIENNVPFEVEYRIYNKSGELKWFFERGRPIRGDNGNPSYIDGVIFDITKQKEAEKKLKESEEKYRLLFENANDGISILDLEGNFYEVNNLYCTRLGYTREEILKSNIRDIDTQEYADLVSNRILDIREKGFNIFESAHRAKDGRIIPVEISSKSILYDNKPTILSIVRDITERKKIEEELRENEKLLKNAQELAHIGHWKLDPSTMEVSGSDELFKIFGLTHDEASLEKFVEVVHPEDREMDLFHIRRGMEKGESWDIEHRVISKDGTEKWVHALGEAIKDDDDKVIMLMGTVQDITERRKIMEELRIKDIIFNASLSAQSTTDINGIINHANPAFLEMWGYKSKEEAIGNSVGSFFANHNDVVPVFEALRETGKWEGDFVAKRCDGSTFISQGFASAIYNENDGQIGFQSTNLNITKRKEAELKLKNETEKVKKYLGIAGVVILALDIEGNINVLNKKGYKLLKYEEGELIGKNWFETCIPIHNRKDVSGVFESLMRNDIELVEFYENSILTKSGEEKIIAWKNTIIHDDNGKIIGTLSSGEDITERKKAEQKLKESEEKFRLLFESIADPIHIIDEDLKIIYMNPAFERWLKSFNLDLNIIGKNPVEAWPFIGERVNAEYQKVFKTKKIHIKEDWAYADDRSTFTETRKIPILKSGNVVQVITIIRDFSDRKKAEEKLKESEENFRKQNVFLNNILESLTHPLYVINVKDYTIALANSTASSEGLEYGKYCYSLTHNNDKPCEAPCICPFNVVKNTKKTCVVEHTHYDQEGNEKIYEIYGYPILDENGNVVQMIEYAINITDRKIAQQELKKSEEKYRHLFENSPYYIILLDKEGIFIDCNNTTVDIYGYPKEDFYGKNFKEMPIIPPDLLPLLENVMELLFKGEMPPPIEFKPITKDGKKIWINSQASLIKLDNEFFIYIIGQDITERKKTELKIKESEENYRDLANQWRTTFDAMSEAVFLLDLECNILQCNKATLDILGAEKYNEIIGHSCCEIIHGTIEPVEWCPMARMIKSSHKEASIAQIGDKWCDISLDPVINDEGTLIGAVHIIKDITERKKAERELKESEQALKVSEEKYRSFIENFQGIAYQGYEDYSADFFHGAVEEITGYTTEDFMSGRIKWNQLFHPDDASKFRTMQEKFGKIPQTQLEYRIKAKDGSTHWILSKTQKFYDEIKNRLGGRGIFIDITDKKKAEQQLKESEEKFRTIAEQSFMSIYIIQDGLIKYRNQRAADVSEYSEEDIKNWKPYEYAKAIHPEDRMFVLDQSRKKEKGETDVINRHKYRIVKKSGEIAWVDNFSKTINFMGKPAVLIITEDITEKILAEQKIKESEKKYRHLFESSPYFIGLIDEDGILVDCNSSISKFLSMRTKEDVIGKKILDTLSIVEENKEIIPLMKKLFQEAYSNEQGKSYEFKLHRSIGGFLWLKVEGSIVEINNHKLLQFIAQDITNRKMIEEELKESEIKFRTISEQFLMGIGILQDEEVKYANLKLANMYGYDVEEFIGKTYSEFLNLIHPEDRAKLIRQVEKRKDRTRDTGVFYQFRAFKKTGELFWANIYSRIITYQGKRAGLLAILDNTEIKMAELKLKESEEKFRKIAEQSFMGIIIRQHDSIKYVNEAAINIFGYPMEDVKEWSNEYITEKCIYAEDLPYIRENRRTERDRKPEIKQFLSYRIITKSGKLRWVDQYSKIFLYQGEISELITIVDITEKKEAERIIIEENKKLLELDKMRRDFMIRASHELKTPLNSIYSTSEFLLHYNEEILDEKLKKFLKIIYKGGKRLKMLIENLLDVSRIESAKFELNMAEKNIIKIIENCIKEVYFLSKRRNISIIFEKSEDILLALDKIRMEQVIANILVNAIKNTPNYGEVIIKTLQEEDLVKISIKDTGVGFTEEEKSKTFEKFGKIERYGQGMDIDTEGSGLGLFISKEIVELHGGDIELLSQGRNKGSTFIIRLPL